MSVGKNPRNSDVEKITCLQTLRTGSARNVIESFGTNSSQYDQAIEELTIRFGSQKLIVACYIKELEDFERPHLHDYLSFVRYLTFLRKLVRNFEANEETSNLGLKYFKHDAQKASSCCFDELGGVLGNPRFRICYINRPFKIA